MASMFRNLKADEIDCRISQIKSTKEGKPYAVTLLLYKDARCDQAILDETVGPMRWQREHLRDNRNCKVSIWDTETKQWISKEDTGTESNTEKEKGLASDSFKRACFNWGIGRELYSAPYIEIKVPDCDISIGKNGRPACWDNFRVTEIVYDGDVISGLKITNQRKRKVVFSWGKEQEKPVAEEIAHEEPFERPVQTAPQAAQVTEGTTVPPAAQKAPQAAKNAPQAAPETPAAYIKRMIIQMQTDFGPGFDFMMCRKALIDGGVIPNKPSAAITTMEEARQMIGAFYDKFGKKAG